jgi:hypothetical protein
MTIVSLLGTALLAASRTPSEHARFVDEPPESNRPTGKANAIFLALPGIVQGGLT